MSGSDFSDESPQTISVSQRSRNVGYNFTFQKSITIPGLDPKSREELGYPGVDRWKRSLQATETKSQYFLGLFFLFVPLIVYVVTLGNYFHPNLYWAPIFGIIALGLRLNISRKLAKNGATLLKLKTIPEIGGQASGTIRFVKPMRGSQSVEIKMVCYEKDAIRTNNSTYDVEYWSIKQSIPVWPDGRESIVTFKFDLPTGLPTAESLGFYWRLELQGAASKKNMYRSWRMPVDRAQSSYAEPS